jgi:hypothetical protein
MKVADVPDQFGVPHDRCGFEKNATVLVLTKQALLPEIDRVMAAQFVLVRLHERISADSKNGRQICFKRVAYCNVHSAKSARIVRVSDEYSHADRQRLLLEAPGPPGAATLRDGLSHPGMWPWEYGLQRDLIYCDGVAVDVAPEFDLG